LESKISTASPNCKVRRISELRITKQQPFIKRLG